MLDLQHYDVFEEQIVCNTDDFMFFKHSNDDLSLSTLEFMIPTCTKYQVEPNFSLSSINTFKITQMHVKCTSNLLIRINKMFPPKFDIHLPRTDCVQENLYSFLQSLLPQSRGISISLQLLLNQC